MNNEINDKLDEIILRLIRLSAKVESLRKEG